MPFVVRRREAPSRTTSGIDVATGLDWAALMEVALGALGWTPAVFWAATPTELGRAIEGRLALRGGRRSRWAEPVARADYAALKARFPDQRV